MYLTQPGKQHIFWNIKYLLYVTFGWKQNKRRCSSLKWNISRSTDLVFIGAPLLLLLMLLQTRAILALRSCCSRSQRSKPPVFGFIAPCDKSANFRYCAFNWTTLPEMQMCPKWDSHERALLNLLFWVSLPVRKSRKSELGICQSSYCTVQCLWWCRADHVAWL